MSTPHVAIGVLAGTTGGPASYGRRLVQALATRGDLRLTVVCDDADRLGAIGTGVDIVVLPMRGGPDRLRWQHIALPRALRRLRPDVYHDTKNALPFGLGVPAVVTVHDLAYYTCPETFGFLSRAFLRHATRDAARRARRIVVPSEATASDMRRWFPATAARLVTAPHGIDPAPDVPAARIAELRARLSLPEHFVLHVGTIQKRKNVDLVIAGVRLLRAEGLPHRAVIVGRMGWLADATRAELARDDTALWLPHAEARDLAALYAAADAFVSPSAYEGFGLAVADALAAGVPTVVADRGSLPELCADAAVRLTDLSAAAVAAALRPILTEAACAADLRSRGRRRAAAFPWERSAELHAAAYRAAMLDRNA